MPPKHRVPGRAPVLVVWPSGQAGSALAQQLRQDGVLAYSASALSETRDMFPDGGPAAVVIESGSALLEYEHLKEMLADDPVLQILIVGRDAAHLPEMGDTVHWVPHSGQLHETVGSHLLSALKYRTAAFRIEGLAVALKSTEEQRSELTRRFADLVEEIQDVVFEFDTLGRVLAINAACGDVIGYSKTQATSLRIDDILGLDSVEPVLDLARDALEQGQRRQKLVVARRRGGQPFLAEISIVPIIHKGQSIGGRAVLRDVGGRQRTEEQLRLLATFYWSLSSTLERDTLLARISGELAAVSGVPHYALFLLDADGTALKLAAADRELAELTIPAGPRDNNVLAHCLRSATGTLVEITGVGLSPLSSCPVAQALALGSMSVPAPCKGVTRCTQSPEARGQCVLRDVLAPTALLLPLISGPRPLGVLVVSGPDGEPWQSDANMAHLSLIAQYLSAALNNVRLHEEAITYASRLERTLEDLRATQSKLARSEHLAAFSEVAMGVSHELRNPLNAITLMLYNHKEDLADPSPEAEPGAAVRSVDAIVTEVLRLKQILDDLLAVARRSPEPPRVLDLNQTVSSTVETLRLQLEQQRVAVQLELTADVPQVLGEHTEVRRALINLILNAAEAMPEGGAITLRTSAAEGWVTCAVCDTGAGISAADRERIFDPFFTTKECGTGLGLSLVHRVMRDVGGRVSLSSEVGQGSEFVLHFPIAEKERTASCGS